MDKSNTERVFSLCKNLLRNPRFIASYARYSLIGRKLPIDYSLPWWSFSAIEEADRVLKDKIIFEYGTGGSTLRYSKIAKQIDAVENDFEWADLVRERLQREGIANVRIVEASFDFRNPVLFKESEYLHAFSSIDSSASYDAVIIDGQDWTFKERITCFQRVEPSMRNNGIIIVDDFWRYTQLLSNNNAKNVKVFESVGPCRIGVTSTAFFYY